MMKPYPPTMPTVTMGQIKTANTKNANNSSRRLWRGVDRLTELGVSELIVSYPTFEMPLY